MKSRLWSVVVMAIMCCEVAHGMRSLNENPGEEGGNRIGRSTRTAVFAMGSFWRAETIFGCIPGVIRTQVGYSGGSKQNPDYHNMADHAESVEVEYDPAVIRYEQLLDIFWSNHDSTQLFGQGPDVGEQYRSIIFTQSDEEASLAVISRKREQAKLVSTEVTTEIESLEMFYSAELEHQKFEMRRRPILVQLLGDSIDEENLRSTTAARLNGYAAGMCPSSLQKLIDNKLNLYLKYKPNVHQLF